MEVRHGDQTPGVGVPLGEDEDVGNFEAAGVGEAGDRGPRRAAVGGAGEAVAAGGEEVAGAEVAGEASRGGDLVERLRVVAGDLGPRHPVVGSSAESDEGGDRGVAAAEGEDVVWSPERIERGPDGAGVVRSVEADGTRPSPAAQSRPSASKARRSPLTGRSPTFSHANPSPGSGHGCAAAPEARATAEERDEEERAHGRGYGARQRPLA